MDPEAPRRNGRHLLAVDDEPPILDVLEQGLRFAGFSVATAATGAAARAHLARNPVDLVLLDVMLPDTDGFELCRELREAGNWVPVIFLTARDADVDLIEGFHRGADDYVTKPFRLSEIVARVEAVLRRSAGRTATAGAAPPAPGAGDAPPPGALVCADLVLDEARHTVHRGGTPIALSPTEFRLLAYLMHNADLALSRYQIIDRVWGDADEVDATTLATYVSYLRRKLNADGGPDLIATIYGHGYALRAP